MLLSCGAEKKEGAPGATGAVKGSAAPVAANMATAPATTPKDPVAFAKSMQTAVLTKDVNSPAGVQYKLPADWEVSDGAAQSNFRAPMLLDAKFAAIDLTIRGDVARASIQKIFGRPGGDAAADVPQLLQSFHTDYNLAAPSEVALPDGRRAMFAAYGDDREMTGLYLVIVGDDDYLKVTLTVRDPGKLVDAKLADYRDVFDRIAASAQPAS